MDPIEQEYIELITQLQACADKCKELSVRSIKSAQPASMTRYAGDPRGLSISTTHIETAMLWIANARPQGETVPGDGR